MKQLKSTALISVIVIMAVTSIVIMGTITLASTNLQGSSAYVDSVEASYITFSGSEDAKLRILRNPMLEESYETDLSNGRYSVDITGINNSKIVTILNKSTNYLNRFYKQIIIELLFNGNLMSTQSYFES